MGGDTTVSGDEVADDVGRLGRAAGYLRLAVAALTDRELVRAEVAGVGDEVGPDVVVDALVDVLAVQSRLISALGHLEAAGVVPDGRVMDEPAVVLPVGVAEARPLDYLVAADDEFERLPREAMTAAVLAAREALAPAFLALAYPLDARQ